jgi:predicted nucleic acid-binding protein
MKLLIDTNVILDLLLAREPFLPSARAVLKKIQDGYAEGFTTASCITDIVYVCKKEYPLAVIRKEILKLLNLIDVIGVERGDIIEAFDTGFSDYEDALQSCCASKEDIDFIVTRNVKDFAKSKVNAISPEGFLTRDEQ